ncbi:unnamed protein product [Colias eurytheme]|nr:unnamed protein product [Colias eurytheme]
MNPTNYTNIETFTNFQQEWQKNRKSYESAIRLALRDNYGYKGMNVYIRKSVDSHRIANGFYVHDNVVGVLCQDMFLGELPHFTSPEVTMALASNALRIETGLSKMFVYTQYILFRNYSDVVVNGRNLSEHSPFSFQDVHYVGPLAITAEDCTLSGYAITKLSGQSVDLGHNTFTVSDCKFSVEISSLGMGLAPVTAPYFNNHQSRVLEKLISKPIREELVPKLQASLLTYVNTSNIFGDKLAEYRQYQTKLFKETSKYFISNIRALNKNTVRINQGAILMKSFSVTWNVCEEKPCKTSVSLKDIYLYGLDTVYSSHSGGPYKLQSKKIGEAICYNYLQVRGIIGFKNDTISTDHDFFAELYDVNVNIEIDIEKDVNVCDFVDWRSLELSIIGFKGNVQERTNANSLISGHLINEIPKVLIDHTLQFFKGNKRPTKLSEHISHEKFDDINTEGQLSRSVEYQEYNDKGNDQEFAAKKKKFDKRGEISKGSNPKKNKFDKRGEVRKKVKMLAKSSTSSQEGESSEGSDMQPKHKIHFSDRGDKSFSSISSSSKENDKNE